MRLRVERLGVTGVAGEESAVALLVLLGAAEDGVVKAYSIECSGASGASGGSEKKTAAKMPVGGRGRRGRGVGMYRNGCLLEERKAKGMERRGVRESANGLAMKYQMGIEVEGNEKGEERRIVEALCRTDRFSPYTSVIVSPSPSPESGLEGRSE